MTRFEKLAMFLLEQNFSADIYEVVNEQNKENIRQAYRVQAGALLELLREIYGWKEEEK